MSKRPTLKVSKTDAAKRQLETAIRLWFHSGEPVSIHTLAAAAHQILHDIGVKRGVATILRNPQNIRPEYRKEFREIVSRYENFFKHADKDPDALLDFNPQATEMQLLDAVLTYEILTQECAPILNTFKAWMFFQNPRFMNEKDREKLLLLMKNSTTDFARMPKAEFFKDWQSALMQSGMA
jgi:hypothetical protein